MTKLRSAPTNRLSRLSKAIAIAPIKFYATVISPALPRRCRYEPTCSAYAIEAIRQEGLMRGLVLSIWRILRCNPWSRGGFDPVSAQRLFHIKHHHTQPQ